MSNPWTPGPWHIEDCHGEGSVYIVASGNPLLTRGRSRRAKTHRALIAAAPGMAEVLERLLHVATVYRLGEADTAEARALLISIRGEKK